MSILTTIKRHDIGQWDIELIAFPEEFPDLSWDEDGSIAERLENGDLILFCAAVRIHYKGVLIGSSYLGNCIYPTYRDFLSSNYPLEMTREAVAQARQWLNNTPKLKDLN